MMVDGHDNDADQARRILVVGVGSIGERHVRCFLETARADVGICEPNGSLRGRISKDYSITHSYESVEAASQQRWDGVVIATPANTHLPIAIHFAKQPCHLLIEKPLATDLSLLPTLRQLIVEQRLRVAVAYVLRLHPVLARLRELTQSQPFGQPLQVMIQSGQHFPTYRPAYRETYYADHRTGGGAIQDALTHLVNLAEWIAGPIESVACDAEHFCLEGVDVEDTVHFTARHRKVSDPRPTPACRSLRPMTSICLNQHQAPNEVSITVVMTGGTVRCDLHHQQIKTQTDPKSAWDVESFEVTERDSIFVRQADAFLDLIGETGEAVCSLDEAESTLRACLTALGSIGQSLTSTTRIGSPAES